MVYNEVHFQNCSELLFLNTTAKLSTEKNYHIFHRDLTFKF